MAKKKASPEQPVEQAVEERALIQAESIKPAVIFSDKGEMDKLLQLIKKQVDGFIADTKTAVGRKNIASIAYKVAQSKVVIDAKGKDFVADQKKALKVVDDLRKHARDFLEDLREDVRKPLSDYEAAIEREKLAKAAAEKYVADWAEALHDNEIYDRDAKLRAAEMKLKVAEEVTKTIAASIPSLANSIASGGGLGTTVERKKEDATQDRKKEVNVAIRDWFVGNGVDIEIANRMVFDIVTGKVRYLTINY